jgi:MFS family permease
MLTQDARSPSPDDGSLFAPLKHRAFRQLWAGFVVSHVGDFVQLIAQNWLVVELTSSAQRVAIVAFAQALPRLFISLFAGVLVDRVDRRRLLQVTQSLAAVQSLVFLALVATGRITYGALVVLAFALGIFDTLNLTARQALMPTLVPRPLLARAVALQALGVNVTQILGPLTSAALLGFFRVEGCLVFNAVSFVWLLFALARVALPLHEGPAATQRFGDDLREGLSYVRARPVLLYPIVLAWALGFLGMPLARLLPLFARQVLRSSAEGYGLLAVASGIGALSASLLVTARAARASLPRNVLLAGAMFSCALALFGTTRSFASAWIVLAVFGASQMAFRSAVVTLLQLEVADRMRGRVTSLLAIDFSLWSMGAMLVGVVADALARVHGGPTREAITWGLTRSFAAHGAACLLCVLLCVRPLMKGTERSIP